MELAVAQKDMKNKYEKLISGDLHKRFNALHVFHKAVELRAQKQHHVRPLISTTTANT